MSDSYKDIPKEVRGKFLLEKSEELNVLIKDIIMESMQPSENVSKKDVSHAYLKIILNLNELLAINGINSPMLLQSIVTSYQEEAHYWMSKGKNLH